MKRVKTLHGWGIYALNAKEQSEYGFRFAVIHPEEMGCGGLTPADTDWPCDTEKEAISWIVHYDSES